MANFHYGKIGDVWKHLPLAEILSIEKPNVYLESHAGSAQYSFTHSADIEYGVSYFQKHANESIVLTGSAYNELLKRYVEDDRLMTYPGSPLIAMSLLQRQGEKYLFCDTDEISLDNIKETSKELGIPENIVKVNNVDGVSSVCEELLTLDGDDALKALVHIDPYDIFEKGENGFDSIDLFCQACRRGAKTIVWYGLGASHEHSLLLEKLRLVFKKNKFDPKAHNLWLGEIQLTAFKDIYSNYNPGVFGCGIICGNLGDRSLSACEQLGRELEKIYKSASLPDCSNGAIKFISHGQI